ncbi:MAG: branched-chain amino acid ABC transporter permease [Cyclobacteriaceae bacterium]|nr:branched-chain amino acid ABC transporter permease [Cyclobacteriaceae bacterium]
MKLKKHYFEDVRLFRTTASLLWTLVLLTLLFAIPMFLKVYYLSVLNLMALNIIVALGLNMLVGNTGQISLGHAGFVAIGAYTTAFLLQSGVPFILTLVLAGTVAALIGAFLGLPSLRLEGPYLAIVTLGFGLAIMVIIGRIDIFGGRMGITVPKLNLDWTGLKYDEALYYVFLGTTILMSFIAHSILKSRIGRAFRAIRDSDIAASVIGVNLALYKTLCFAISAFFAGTAGCLWALYLQFVTPGTFNFMMSVIFLATVVLGGLGSVTGSILGAVVMTFLSLQLDKIVDVPLVGTLIVWFSDTLMNPSGIANIKWVLTGLVLVLVIIFEPRGLNGVWLRIKRYWRLWPF